MLCANVRALRSKTNFSLGLPDPRIRYVLVAWILRSLGVEQLSSREMQLAWPDEWIEKTLNPYRYL